MELSEIREKINTIDDRLKQLFEERLACSKQVADVKMKTSDQVFKPLREKEIAKRFSAPEEQDYLAYVKKVIALSRKFQYQQFIQNKMEDAKFLQFLVEHPEIKQVFETGGILSLCLGTDSHSETALSIPEVLSVLSDSKLSMETLSVNSKQQLVLVSFRVDSDENSKNEAYLLTYMLYQETNMAAGKA